MCIRDSGTTIGLHVRRSVAVPTDGASAGFVIRLDLETWAEILSTKMDFSEAILSGDVELEGDAGRLREVLAAFDHATLAQ